MYIPSASSLLENPSTLLPSRPSPLQTATALTAHASAARGLVVIDADVADTDTLLAGLAPGIDVLRLDSNADGIAQVTQALSGRHDLTSLHFLTHGEAGDFGLGGTRVDRARLTTDGEEIQTWARAFTSDAAILLYGCNVAADGEGKALVGQLSALTGKEVEASTDLTGSSTLGGNWELEYKVGGDRDVPVAFNLAAREAYQQVLATFTVTSSAEFGTGTLREAVDKANSASGADEIKFNLSTTDPGYHPATPSIRAYWTVKGTIPAITDTVSIDGTTQPGFNGSPVIELNGLKGATVSNGVYLRGAQSSNSTIRGLVINEYWASGVRIDRQSNNSHIEGNYIGTDITGTIERGNGISYNYLQDHNVCIVDASNNILGGDAPAQRNLISGSITSGIVIFPGLTYNPNDPDYHTNGNLGASRGNQIIGNYIGTDVTGTKALGNHRYGVFIEGNDTLTARNIISANGYESPGAAFYDFKEGYFTEFYSQNNRLIENLIGTDITGTQNLGNGRLGVFLNGFNHLALKNIIAFNGWDGVRIQYANSATISQNSIFSNLTQPWPTDPNGQPQAGIVLDNYWTVRGYGNHDRGAPYLYSVAYNNGNTTISGYTRSYGGGHRIEFFSGSSLNPRILSLDLGPSEGRNYLGSTDVGGDGNFSFSVPGIIPDAYVTATDTGIYNGDTSPFSNTIYTPSIVSFNAPTYEVKFVDGVATITLKRAGNISDPSRVQLNFVNDTAIGGSTLGTGVDFVNTLLAIDFKANQTTATFAIAIYRDGLAAYNKQFKINLSDPNNKISFSPIQQVTVTIQEGNEFYAVKASTPKVFEGNIGQKTPISFTITRTGDTQSVGTVDFRLLGTANLGSNYEIASLGGTGISLAGRTVTFAVGATTAVLTLNVLGNNIYDPDRTIQVQLTAPTAPGVGKVLDPGIDTTLILNDKAPPQIAIADVTQKEGDSGIQNFDFTIALDRPSYQTIVIDFSTGNGSAIAGIDYNAIAGKLTFAPGETSKIVRVGVIGNTTYELDKTFRVEIGPSNDAIASIGKSRGTATIVNDDPIPSVTVNDVTGQRGDRGTSNFTFRVTLSNPSYQAIVLTYSTQDVSAIAGIDYNAVGNGVLTFTPGETSKEIVVGVIGSKKFQPAKVFDLELGTPTGAIAIKSVGLGTIFPVLQESLSWEYYLQFLVDKGQDLTRLLFDENYYLSGNADVKTAVAKGSFASGFAHFLKYGQYEGRDPSVYFSNSLYLDENPDVAAALAKNQLRSGFQHFVQFGFYEHRDLRLLLFDEGFYLANNTDVKDAVGRGVFQNGYQHYLLFGQGEGRNPSPQFDEAYYLSQNPDVRAAVGTGATSSAFTHFVTYGIFEGRNPSAFFSNQQYLADNPDVGAASDGFDRGGFAHALRFGEYEGRALEPQVFDESYYLANNPDVAERVRSGLFRSGFDHFILYGQTEGRQPSTVYSEAFYLQNNPDVAESVRRGIFRSGFEHFLRFGRAEGREGTA